MGVTARELQIITLFESARSIEEIAAATGLGERYVRNRVNELCFSVGPDRQHHASMAKGSQLLREAIEQARAA